MCVRFVLFFVCLFSYPRFLCVRVLKIVLGSFFTTFIKMSLISMLNNSRLSTEVVDFNDFCCHN